jgi:hypothetical protein
MKVCSLAVKIAFTVSTGLLTSVCAVASLVSVSALRIQANLKVFTFDHLKILAFGHTLVYVAFYFCLGRCRLPHLFCIFSCLYAIDG